MMTGANELQNTSGSGVPNQIVVNQDNGPFPVTIILDETNYTIWVQLMEMRITARNKGGYLTGDAKKPNEGDPSYTTWVTENQKVRSWLIEAMNPTLMQRFIRLPTAKAIWDALARTFYDASDETVIFELNQKTFTTRQNGRQLSTYYNELVALFQEIDHRSMEQANTVDGVLQVHSAMTRLRVHIFLAGLDQDFDQVRGEILRKETKLDLESTYAYVRREAQQRQTMNSHRNTGESTVLMAKKIQQELQLGPQKQKSRKSEGLTCTHCGESGHSKARCYEIIGYPDWWDFSKRPRRKVNAKAMPVITDSTKTTELEAPVANAANVASNSGKNSSNLKNEP